MKILLRDFVFRLGWYNVYVRLSPEHFFACLDRLPPAFVRSIGMTGQEFRPGEAELGWLRMTGP